MLTGLCALAAFQQIHATIVTINEELHSRTARALAADAALEKIRDSEYVTRKQFVCRNGEGSKGDIQITSSLCSFIYPADLNRLRESIVEGPEGFPGLDFNAIFSAVSETECESYSWEGNAPSGFHLTSSAAVSRSLCRLTSDVTIKDVRTSGNLMADSPLRALNPDSEAAFALLAATGFIDIAAPVIAEKDLLVVAGGDLHIKGIYTSSPVYMKVTLISSTGVVQVDEIGSFVSVKALGREGVRLPPAYIPPFQHMLLPILLEKLPFSLRWGP